MERYEYLNICLGKRKDRKAEMDKLGSNGWELVCIYRNRMYFKRVKRSM